MPLALVIPTRWWNDIWIDGDHEYHYRWQCNWLFCICRLFLGIQLMGWKTNRGVVEQKVQCNRTRHHCFAVAQTSIASFKSMILPSLKPIAVRSPESIWEKACVPEIACSWKCQRTTSGSAWMSQKLAISTSGKNLTCFDCLWCLWLSLGAFGWI